MKENLELLEHIYQDSEMAAYSITTLLKDLRDKDNKIKKIAEDILKEYEEWNKKVTDRLDKNNGEQKDSGLLSKMGASMGIKKEVKDDNSDSSIADMLIKGISMGTLDMEKKIKDYEQEANKEDLKIAKDFLSFQQKSIEKLKEFL